MTKEDAKRFAGDMKERGLKVEVHNGSGDFLLFIDDKGSQWSEDGKYIGPTDAKPGKTEFHRPGAEGKK